MKGKPVTTFDEINTSEFLRQLQEGSVEAYEHLFRRLLSPLVRFLVGTMGLPERDAEETASDVLFSVYKKIGSYNPKGGARLTTWIFQIAKNRAIDVLRKTEQLLPEPEPAGALAGRNERYVAWISGQLKSLSSDDRELVLSRAAGISYTEIARSLGITEGTARVRHSRLIERLKKAAEEGGPSAGAARV